jgi:predicted RND superfamily exporter protein
MLNFGFMGVLGFPLDIVTAMIAAIGIGIGIDYSIHFLSGYIREYRAHRDHHRAAEQTASITGKAIVYNALSVAAGFAVLVFSIFTPLNTLGIMMSLTMVSSSSLAIMILPFLLRLLPATVLERLTTPNLRKVEKPGKKNKKTTRKINKRTFVEVLR